jgi:uncharacterized membrane protein YphA (DoxX/SURF4 family)
MLGAGLTLTTWLVAGIVASRRSSAKKHPKVVEQIGGVGVPLKYFPLLAGLEVAAAVGIVIGLGVRALGIAAAAGAVLYMLGAIASHLRVKDTKGAFNPVVPLIMAVATLVLRIATKA